MKLYLKKRITIQTITRPCFFMEDSCSFCIRYDECYEFCSDKNTDFRYQDPSDKVCVLFKPEAII